MSNFETRLFHYLNEKFTAIDEKFEQTATKADVEALRVAVDSLNMQYDRLDTEHVAMSAHMSRTDKQIENHHRRLYKLENST